MGRARQPLLRIAFPSADRPEVWCAEAAVQALGGGITWLHPLAALPDHVAQLADAQVDGLARTALGGRGTAGGVT